MQSLEKVTAFVTRSVHSVEELLLIEHPNAGIQIPAGTVEPGEDPSNAVLREAVEETGLSGFSIVRSLGWRDEPAPDGYALMGTGFTLYARPDPASFDFARLPRALLVKVERQSQGFTQVTYREYDQATNPDYVTYQITGWVPDHVLLTSQRRHFYQLNCAQPRNNCWTVDVDYHRFTLFWARLDNLPAIISPQDSWIATLTSSLEKTT
jgi:8-oxo-dGTP pyrophosphatase MutT (NUDIX family)